MSDAEIAARYRAGESTARIAAEAGCSLDYVVGLLKEGGLLRACHRRATAGRPKRGSAQLKLPLGEIIRRYERGWSLDRISVDAGVSSTHLIKRLREAGVDLRTVRARPPHGPVT